MDHKPSSQCGPMDQDSDGWICLEFSLTESYVERAAGNGLKCATAHSPMLISNEGVGACGCSCDVKPLMVGRSGTDSEGG